MTLKVFSLELDNNISAGKQTRNGYGLTEKIISNGVYFIIKPRKFFLYTKGENGIMKRETEPEEELPAFRGSKSSKGEWRL